jgi:CRISPR/Cas system-associated exonuclease Cas4 (RecB family)
MAMVFDILEEEKRRLLSLKARYEQQLSELPKGSISRKKRWNREYLYLAYRESGKVKFEYIASVDSEAAQEVEAKVRRRKDLEEKLSQVEKNLADVERGLRGRR